MAEHCGLLKEHLEELPTLAQGQADDLKIDTGKIRVWLSRVDGSVSIEAYDEKTGKWELASEDVCGFE